MRPAAASPERAPLPPTRVQGPGRGARVGAVPPPRVGARARDPDPDGPGDEAGGGADVEEAGHLDAEEDDLAAGARHYPGAQPPDSPPLCPRLGDDEGEPLDLLPRLSPYFLYRVIILGYLVTRHLTSP